MQRVILSDTSCLILLDKIGEFILSKQSFGKITVTKEMKEEFHQELPDGFEIDSPKNKTDQKILEASLDKGEASAIAFALEQKNCLSIIDDLKGRKYAEQLGSRITGTLGVWIEAKLSGHLNSIVPSLERIKKTDFRLTVELERKAPEMAGELRF